jgi:hypothetical protein
VRDTRGREESMIEIKSRWKNATDRGKWAARGGSFVAKVKATKAVWFPPEPVETGRSTASTATKASRKTAGAATRKTTGATKKTAGAAKKTTGAAKKTAGSARKTTDGTKNVTKPSRRKKT